MPQASALARVIIIGAIAVSIPTHSVRAGPVWCWGANTYGQVGDGTLTDRCSVTGSPIVGDATMVCAGGQHSLALLPDMTLLAWGLNSSGQLGLGVFGDASSPQPAGLGRQFVSISAGGVHSLAVARDWTVWSWGGNDYSQLGDNTTSLRKLPIQVGTFTNGASTAAGGAHSIVLLRDSTLLAFGSNGAGQIGTGSLLAVVRKPTVVPGVAHAVQIAAGEAHSLAVLADGSLLAWGDNHAGQLGDGTNTTRRSPVTVSGVATVRSVVAGGAHSIALLSDGTVMAWGLNASGQLGDGTTADRITPMPVPGLAGIIAVAATESSSFALEGVGRLWAWGGNARGELALGDTARRLVPTQVPPPSGHRFRSVAGSCSGRHMVATLMEGEVGVPIGGGLPESELILNGAVPNPARGGRLYVTFALPSAGPARLEMLDVAGRRMAAHEVGALGAGYHALQLTEGTRLPQGMYLIRLSQGDRVITRRIALIR